MDLLEKIADILQFREGTIEDDYNEPVVTTGSIIFGAIIRSALIILPTFFVVEYFELRGFWWVTAFFVWLFAAYPAYRQYSKYNERMALFEEETLCGKCKHFEASGQLCRILDEHVTRNNVPCEGLSWEPKHFDTEN